jgi:hypothetical protein
MNKFWISTPELMAMEIPPLRWIIESILPEGLSILVGRQKLGKSQLALNMAVAVEIGGTFLGYRVPSPGAVLYLDLELGQRRVRHRLDGMFPSAGQRPPLTHLHWFMPNSGVAFPQLGKDFYARLDEWRAAAVNPRLIIIDIIANVMPRPEKGLNSYQAENKMLAPLRDYANQHGIAIVMVHHTKQGDRNDPLEKASGSNAMTSVPNQNMVLDGKEDDPIATLYMRGHDVDERRLAIRRDNLGWFENLGDARIVFAKATRRKIIDAILANGGPMTRAEIHEATDVSPGTVKKNIQRMLTAKPPQLVKDGDKLDIPREGKVSPSVSEVEKPLNDKGNLAQTQGTVAVSPNVEECPPVPEDGTQGTVGDSESVPAAKPYGKRDSDSKGTVIENSPLMSKEEKSRYLLKWLYDHGTVTFRFAQQRTSPALKGSDVRDAAPALVKLGHVEISEDGKSMTITEAGKLSVNPQASLF